MGAAEGPPLMTVAERQRIERELAALQALVTEIPSEVTLDFMAIHAAASRLTQAAYDMTLLCEQCINRIHQIGVTGERLQRGSIIGPQ